MKRWIAALCTAMALAAAPALAQESAGGPPAAPEMADFWRTWTERDLEAAHALLRDNHPGAVPEVGDTDFRKALEDGYALAQTRVAQVSTYEGYQAVLAAYAWGFGDKHIWSHPTFTVAYPDWAGLLISKQGDDWVVADEDALGGPSLLGAKLVSCDGKPVNDLARAAMAFRGVWSVGAQQVQQAPWLLVDEHNPFLTRPKACDFDLNGQHKTVTLNWRRVRRDLIAPRVRKAAHAGAAGYGVRRVGDGYWIALQDLQSGAPAVIAQVKAQADTLHAAPFVVLDVRGNGGGSSDFGRQIADILYGHAYVDQVLGSEDADDGDCDEVWRLSTGNLRQMDFYQNVLMPTIGADAVARMTKINQQAHTAAAAGQAFTGPTSCPKKAEKPKVKPTAAAALHGRLVLLTDNLCFSSCLILTDNFRDLGALHVGQSTDADTHYMEVREELLPSGLSKFSTQMVLSPGAPMHYGPFDPAMPYPGDIADTKALEAWVIKLMTSAPPATR